MTYDLFNAIFPLDPAIVRDADPISSHHGADHIAPKRRTQRDVLLSVYTAYPDGLTDEEAGRIAGIAGYWKRCAELRKLGLIAPTGDLRTGSSGVKQQVCKVTP